MHRLNEEAVVRALFPFGQQHVDKLRDRMGATGSGTDMRATIFEVIK